MSQSALKVAFEKALKLPETEQAAAADMLEEFVEQHTSSLSLTEAQIAEIKRRLADPGPEYVTDAEVDAFYRRALHED
ncbi:MAG: hypothetical protein ABI740_05360 [Alphaproteobacteria bacterium]